MDHLLNQLDKEIREAKAAIVKWTAVIKRKDNLIAGVAESDPDLVQVQRDWRRLAQDEVASYQNALRTLEAVLEKRKEFLG